MEAPVLRLALTRTIHLQLAVAAALQSEAIHNVLPEDRELELKPGKPNTHKHTLTNTHK